MTYIVGLLSEQVASLAYKQQIASAEIGSVGQLAVYGHKLVSNQAANFVCIPVVLAAAFKHNHVSDI